MGLGELSWRAVLSKSGVQRIVFQWLHCRRCESFRVVPELPEVEITRRKLAPALVGRTVAAVQTTAPSYFFLTEPAVLRRKLRARTFTDLRRHGKYLIADLDDGARVLLHLGMTGQLFAEGLSTTRLLKRTGAGTLDPTAQKGFRHDAHTHVTLDFADLAGRVFFRDPRKFGKVQWLAKGEGSSRLDKLGVDALDAESTVLFEHAGRRRVPIKTLLLDQSVLAGVGNIYADEALFRVGVSPLRPANEVSMADCAELVLAAQSVMLRSIETGGSSISDYVQPDGQTGKFQDERQIYGRTGEACTRCGQQVRREVIGGRASHFCGACQR